MSFHPLYEQAHTISPAVRGLARLIEGGTWIAWCGDGGYWRDLTPPMEEWESIAGCPGATGLSGGRTLRFAREGREVSWPKGDRWGECYPLTAEEQAHLYEIYERVYLLPEAERSRLAAKREAQESQDRARAWLDQLARVGRAAP